MSDGNNVISLVERLEEMRKKSAENIYFPSHEDLKTFLLVLNFIRKLSVSRSGKLEFNEDTLSIVLTHYLDHEDINEYEVVKYTALQEEAEMNFKMSGDKFVIDDAVMDLLNALEGLVEWMESE